MMVWLTVRKPEKQIRNKVGFVGQLTTNACHQMTLSVGSCRQRGREGNNVFFYDDPDCMVWVQSALWSRCFASLDKMLYDDYLCLVASNKQQIQWKRIRKNSQEH